MLHSRNSRIRTRPSERAVQRLRVHFPLDPKLQMNKIPFLCRPAWQTNPPPEWHPAFYTWCQQESSVLMWICASVRPLDAIPVVYFFTFFYLSYILFSGFRLAVKMLLFMRIFVPQPTRFLFTCLCFQSIWPGPWDFRFKFQPTTSGWRSFLNHFFFSLFSAAL